ACVSRYPPGMEGDWTMATWNSGRASIARPDRLLELRLRGGHLAADLIARPLVDIFPLGRIVFRLCALARTCVLGRAAVVLPGLGNAIALFLIRFGRDRPGRGSQRRGADAECKDACQGGLDRGLVIHRKS